MPEFARKMLFRGTITLAVTKTSSALGVKHPLPEQRSGFCTREVAESANRFAHADDRTLSRKIVKTFQSSYKVDNFLIDLPESSHSDRPEESAGQKATYRFEKSTSDRAGTDHRNSHSDGVVWF